ncbi:MAG: hypothetical protein AAE977_01540 [Thermoplasmataceae archaeon]|jgi:hypothetical protein
MEQFGQRSTVTIPTSIDQKIKDTIKNICERISDIKNWAIDSSTSLVLQVIDLMPDDIDILTD